MGGVCVKRTWAQRYLGEVRVRRRASEFNGIGVAGYWCEYGDWRPRHLARWNPDRGAGTADRGADSICDLGSPSPVTWTATQTARRRPPWNAMVTGRPADHVHPGRGLRRRRAVERGCGRYEPARTHQSPGRPPHPLAHMVG